MNVSSSGSSSRGSKWSSSSRSISSVLPDLNAIPTGVLPCRDLLGWIWAIVISKRNMYILKFSTYHTLHTKVCTNLVTYSLSNNSKCSTATPYDNLLCCSVSTGLKQFSSNITVSSYQGIVKCCVSVHIRKIDINPKYRYNITTVVWTYIW